MTIKPLADRVLIKMEEADADRTERGQVRKVRASQGRVPDNVWWRRLQGQCNRNVPPESSGKGGRAV